MTFHWILFFCLVSIASCSFFYVTEGQTRCFSEEVPEDTFVLVMYKIPSDAMDLQESGLNIHVIEPNSEPDQFWLQQGLVKNAGLSSRFAFTSRVGGEHHICVSFNSTELHEPPLKEKLLMRIEIGEHAVDYSVLAKSEHLSAIESEVRKLLDQLQVVRQELSYQHEREEFFRDTSEDTNYRVTIGSILKTVILLLSGIYQIYALRYFFKSKKLV